MKDVATHALLGVKHQRSVELREMWVGQVAPGLHLLPSERGKDEKEQVSDGAPPSDITKALAAVSPGACP